MKQNRIYHYRFAIAWAMLILFACGASPGTLSELKLEDLFGYDKPIHALLFGLQAWLLIQANLKHHNISKHKVIILWCTVSAVFGGLIELMQKFIFTGRSYDYFDMIANALGCVIVYFIAKKKYKNV